MEYVLTTSALSKKYRKFADDGWAVWIGTAPWMAMHLWNHYRYTGDRKFLEERAYPFFREVAMFYEDYLVRDEDGVWTRVAKQNNVERSHWDAYSDTLIFDAVECVQVRITCVNTCGQSSMGIYEIEAYNVNTLTKADNTALEDGANIDIPASVDWAEDVAEPQDYAYSFALVGDTQIVTKNDALNGTNDLDNMYQYIIDKKDDYKIAQVIGLGDIVDTYADKTKINKSDLDR